MIEKKKSLGQHFLHDRQYLGRIANALSIKKGELVVEVGPGEGTLTAEILKRGARVVAVEKDRRLIPVLKEKFAGENFEVIEADALNYDPPASKYKLAGNIPYYITGALLKKFLGDMHQPQKLVFLLQKEVARRIAKSKKESILSLSVKAYGTPRYIKSVPRGAFSPAPKVDSAILEIADISRKNFINAAHEKKFFELVRAGFGKKRKLLKGNLRPLVGERTEGLGNARAEDLSLERWLELAKKSLD